MSIIDRFIAFLSSVLKSGVPSLDRIGPQEFPIPSSVPSPLIAIVPESTTSATIIHPTMPQTPVLPPKTSMLETFCHAIEAFEGGQGDPNHINNNPGDFRCSPVGYLPKYGNVKCTANNFAVFPTYAIGWEYLLESVHHRAVAHPNWTILDFFDNYAPSSDGNPTAIYAENVAKKCGVSTSCTLQVLFS